MASFPSIIPTAERNAVGSRRFGDHAAYTLAKLAPPLPVNPLPDEGPYPGSLPDPGGFDPGYTPPPPDYGGFMPEASGGFMPSATSLEANNGVNLGGTPPDSSLVPFDETARYGAGFGGALNGSFEDLGVQDAAQLQVERPGVADRLQQLLAGAAQPQVVPPRDGDQMGGPDTVGVPTGMMDLLARRQRPDEGLVGPPVDGQAPIGGVTAGVEPVQPGPTPVMPGSLPFAAEQEAGGIQGRLDAHRDLRNRGATPPDVPASRGHPDFTSAAEAFGAWARDRIGEVGGAVGGVLGDIGEASAVGQRQALTDILGPSVGRAERLARPIDEGPTAELALGVAGGPGPAAERAVGAATAKLAAQEVGRLRLDKFPEAVRDTIQAAAADGDFWRTQRRGVIPDAVAEQLADDAGRTIDQMIAGGKAGKAYNTEQTRGIRNALVAQAVKVHEIAAEVAADPTNGRLVAEQVAEGMRLADLSRVAEGARAEAGRALRAYTGHARAFALDPVEAVQRIYRAANLTPETAPLKVIEFQKMVAGGADPIQMAKFWANVERPPVRGLRGAADWFELLRYNAMLSGPRTLMANTLGNAAEIPWRGLRDVGASLAKGRPEEIPAEAIGLARGFQRGIGNALETLKHGITAEQAAAGELPRALSSRLENPVARGTALTLEAPGRVMQATDELFGQMAYGMALGRQAAVKAGEEGLRGRALLARADELFEQPTAGMMKTAQAVRDRMTYKGDLGPVASGLEGVQRIPVIGKVALPFLRTVAHITNRGIDRSPVGIVGTAFDVARGAYRGGAVPKGQAPLGERIPDNLAGLVGGAALYYLASQGLITGAGSQDPEVRDMERAQGKQPYSLKIGDKYVGYQQFGPFAVPLSLAAGAVEAQKYAKPGSTNEQMALDAFRRTAQILTEQPYLQGVGAIYKGISDPGRYGERWVEQFLSTLVPYGAAINTAGQVLDPVQREPNRGDILGALETRIPGLREKLPVRQDVLGRPMESEQAGPGALLPVRTSTDRPDPALAALLGAGVQVSDPPRDVRGIPLSPEEQREYRRVAGEELQKRVEKIQGSASWEKMPAARRTEVLRAAATAAREKAAGQVYAAARRRGVKPGTPPP